ncbi:hypothetical protein IPG41_04590 [Candidatus Peregrinibacteria bacterium]|nr:MAG: hypothetical protein IPG41_04590 [Candidatus Peregrinibacteria bacterium]
MNLINWQQFGLKKDPYDTLPLIEGGDVPIEQAFVGRTKEIQALDNLFKSESRFALAICGDVGVGKTSLANFRKYMWKTAKQNSIFSFRREIEANDYLLNKRNFMIEIIGSILREIRLLQPKLLEQKLLKRLSQIVDITQTLSITGGANILGFGADLGVDKANFPPIQLANASLEQYYLELIDFIKKTEILKKRYKGIIIHVNNFDVVLKNKEGHRKVIDFFNEIRDILQTPDVYFLFLGPRNFFKDIISTQKRVESIFIRTPLFINPLSKTEIVEAFNERMSLLKSEGVISYIKPVEDEVIFQLYDLYGGDIRSIMSAVRDILGQYSGTTARPLPYKEALYLLGKERWERIENEVIRLTPEQKQVLVYLARSDKYISQKEIAQLFKKAQSNVSGYYFKPLRELDIIEEKEKIGRVPYYGLTIKYQPIKFLVNSREELVKSARKKGNQLNLF